MAAEPRRGASPLDPTFGQPSPAVLPFDNFKELGEFTGIMFAQSIRMNIHKPSYAILYPKQIRNAA
ncbi:hypothetical protein EBB79_14875 [Parasedimentitalea marina]|uniref:Uncharacterized protein n=1 Tax=Parasedimentitalea marina TaxID=2483033 RepID=A0A3T0N4T7_9RHOB|nr:hypothetical protein EBB79_14875 [Parasedimentitalea marina]